MFTHKYIIILPCMSSIRVSSGMQNGFNMHTGSGSTVATSVNFVLLVHGQQMVGTDKHGRGT